ncbi:MAG: glycosyltransferase [Desulfobacterales bacterium]|nr:glycosyltransferase [Desulfobacterales bacterium]
MSLRSIIDLHGSDGRRPVAAGAQRTSLHEGSLLDELEKAILADPRAGHHIRSYHNAVLEQAAFVRAREFFRSALKRHPHHRRLHFLLIDILCRLQCHHEAMPEIEAAINDFGVDDGILRAAMAVRERVGVHAGGQGNLSLCMIVRDEERHLARCLQSAKPIADEIILVDTGSTDRTKAIGAVFGAKVYDVSWKNDFSEARNFSLSKASSRWILILDADEVISCRDYPFLRSTVASHPIQPAAYTLTTRNYTNQPGCRGWKRNAGEYPLEEVGRGWFPSCKVRLFLNDPRVHFENPVHETVESSLRNSGVEIRSCIVPIHHYGKLSPDKILSKGRAYYFLGKKKMQECDGDIPSLRELAIQAAEISEFDEAIALWEKVIALHPDDAVAFLNMGYCYLSKRDYSKARIHSKKALSINPSLREAALNCAYCELIVGDLNRAIEAAGAILMKEAGYPPAIGVIALAFYADGQKEKGFQFLLELDQLGFNCVELIREQVRLLASEGRMEHVESLNELSERLEANASHGRRRIHHH